MSNITGRPSGQLKQVGRWPVPPKLSANADALGAFDLWSRIAADRSDPE